MARLPRDADNTVIITFIVEIYNYREIKQDLLKMWNLLRFEVWRERWM